MDSGDAGRREAAGRGRDAGRWNGVVLTAGALAVLAAGGWWWVASDPGPGTVPASAAEALAPPAPVAAFPQPTEQWRVEVMPPEPSAGPGSVWLDPNTGAVVGGAGARPVAIRADRALPVSPDTVWRRTAVVGGQQTRTFSFAAQEGSRFLLQAVCLDDGGMRVDVRGGRIPAQITTPCGDFVRGAAVVARGNLYVSVRSLNGDPIEMGVQLIALPSSSPAPSAPR